MANPGGRAFGKLLYVGLCSCQACWGALAGVWARLCLDQDAAGGPGCRRRPGMPQEARDAAGAWLPCGGTSRDRSRRPLLGLN